MGFCDSSQSQNNQYGWQDPLGPTSMRNGHPHFSPTGAPQLRSGIFNYLSSYTPQMNQAGADYASALKTAAANPAWNQVTQVAEDNAAGKYLNGSPALDRELAESRAGALADAADETARLKSQYAKNGMEFSTAGQQADQSTRAAVNASADRTNALSYLQNYQAERANQNSAGGQLQQATIAPLNYLAQVSGAYSQPLTQEGNLLSALSSGGQVYATGSSGTYSPSMGSNILNGVSALGSF